MAELILTEEEKRAASYLDWDDAALGKFTKHVAMRFAAQKDDAEGFHKVLTTSCAILLVGAAHEANATTLTVDVGGHTSGKVETGDWRVTIERVTPTT